MENERVLSITDINFCLPKLTLKFIEILGLLDTKYLLSIYGGERIYIPRKGFRKNKNLYNISDEVFEKLCDYFSGDVIELPKYDSLRRFDRDLNIIYSIRNGENIKNICKRYDISRRHIYNIKSKYSDYLVFKADVSLCIVKKRFL